MTIETHPIVPVGYDETREWLAKYPNGAVASLIRTDRGQVGPRRPTLIGVMRSLTKLQAEQMLEDYRRNYPEVGRCFYLEDFCGGR